MKAVPAVVAAVFAALGISFIVLRETTQRLDIPSAATHTRIASAPASTSPPDPPLVSQAVPPAGDNPPSSQPEPQAQPDLPTAGASPIAAVPDDPNNTNLAEVRAAQEGRTERSMHSRGSDGQHAE
jgi:hypothetical protein